MSLGRTGRLNSFFCARSSAPELWGAGRWPLSMIWSTAYADTHSQHQSRVGITFEVPFGGSGFKIDDARIGLTYQHIYSKSADTIFGGEANVTTSLHSFDPRIGVKALGGDRRIYAGAGLSYGTTGWGVPVSINAPYTEIGMDNIDGLGGAYAGITSMGPFKKFEHRSKPAPAPVQPFNFT